MKKNYSLNNKIAPSASETKKQMASLNYLKIAPRKVRAVGNLIKGMPVNRAEAELILQRRRPAKALLKLLRSAVANAQKNQQLDSGRLYIESLRVDQGPMLKRYLPRARGTATPIQKKMSNITLVLKENPDLTPPQFKIVVAKKTKMPLEKGAKIKPKEDKKSFKKQEELVKQSEKPGFFRRIFRRKSV